MALSKLEVSDLIKVPIFGYTAIIATYTVTALDCVVNCTSGTFTINLPTAVGISGKVYTIKNSGAGIITVDANGSETIDGNLTQIIIATSSMTILSDGANWIII